jgi:hypothetical protein
MPTYKRDWQQICQTLLQAEPGATAERRAELKAVAQDQAVPWRRIYQGLLVGEPAATAERRAELKTQAMAQVRQAVPYFDATFSPSKDVSVLHASLMAAAVRAQRAGDAREAAQLQELADVVWAAVMEGNQAMLDHLQQHAGYTRSGSHARKVGQVSTGRWEDAHRFVVASFRQHTFRNGDPQPPRYPSPSRADDLLYVPVRESWRPMFEDGRHALLLDVEEDRFAEITLVSDQSYGDRFPFMTAFALRVENVDDPTQFVISDIVTVQGGDFAFRRNYPEGTVLFRT